MKMESHLQKIEIKQSNTDRLQVDYEPIVCKFKANQTIKTTKMRLHFAHTTNNNNRKKNLPNPDQRYFLLVVEMKIILNNLNSQFKLCSSISERVIVRAVNPGQFKQANVMNINNNNNISIISPSSHIEIKKNDSPNLLIKNKDISNENQLLNKNLCLFGNMGIYTTQMDEALNIVGNIKLTGSLMQPSDERVKKNIQEINPNIALGNISKLKLYQYDFKPEFAEINGGIQSDYGILAQELREIIPDAVVETGDLVLSNGEIVNHFLNVKKVYYIKYQ
jgi:myelin regulatory factor